VEVGPPGDEAGRAGSAGLGLHLRGEDVGDPVAWEGGEEVRRASAASIDAWVATVTASGTATPEEVAGGAAAARAQFTPEAEPSAG